MGVSFKKSLKISKNTRINISKDGGLGFSTGFKGFRISKNNEGTRITIGRDGVYWSKSFGKKKKKNKGKTRVDKNGKEVVETEIVETMINPETDFEKVPTKEEEILLYLGNKTIDYVLYLLFGFVLVFAVFYFLKSELVFGIIMGVFMGLTLFYIFVSRWNNYINDLNRSIRLFEKGKYDKCFSLLDKCLAVKPKSNKALLMMVFTAFRLDKFEEALDFLLEYRKNNESFEVLYFIEAFCSVQLGKYQEGMNAIEQIYSEDPEVKFSKYKVLGDCYLGLGDLNKAIAWYELLPVKSKEMDDNILEYKYALGKALFLSGNNKKAFTYLSSVYDYRANYKDVKELIHKIDVVKSVS